MANVGGLLVSANTGAARGQQRFREFQTNVDEMAARERAGLYRRDQAAMDQFTAGLKPQSNIATPDWTMPAAPPAPASSGAGVGAPGTPGYERNRLMQERKLIEEQYNSEVTAQKARIDDLGRQKYILEQQLTVAPAYQQQAIRDNLTALNDDINRVVTNTRARVGTFNTLFKDIDTLIRSTDKGQAIMSGGLPTAPEGYTPGAIGGNKPEQPEYLGTGTSTPIPVPASLEMVPEAPAPQPGAAATTPPPAQVAPDSQAFIASLTPAQFEALPKDKQDAVLAAVNRERQANRDRANLLTVPAAAFDLAVGPVNALSYIFNWASEAGDLPRYARAIGLGDITSIQTPYLGADESGGVTATPYTDVLRRLRENSQPLTREQFLENLKANEQQTSVQEGKGDLPPTGAGIAEPTTAANATASVPALTTPEVPYRDPAVVAASAKKLEAEFLPRAANVGSVVQSPDGQRLIARAKELGVDPAVAIAIYGVETDFGKNVGKSDAGASGVMQVIPATFADMKRVFTDPAEIKRLKIPPALAKVLVEAARNLDPNDETSFDAGLLRLKYAELVGVPKNLIGAGYNASAENVRDAGAPLDAFDGGITNSDYNKAYVTLYNEARGVVNIPPSTTTSQEGIVGNSQTIRQLDAQEQQVMSDYEFATQTINTERQATLAKRQEIARRMTIAQQYSDVTAYEQARTELDSLDTVLRDGDLKLRQAETLTRIEIDKLNLARTDEYVNMAVMELDGGNVEPFADMVSRGTGMLVEIAPIEGGKFAVYQNNQLISGKGYTLEQLKNRYLSPISAAYEAQRAAIVEEERKFNSEALKAELKLAADITLEQIKANGEMMKQGWNEGKEVTDPNTGRVSEKWFTKGNRVIRMRISPDREENGLVVKGGVVVEDISTAGLK